MSSSASKYSFTHTGMKEYLKGLFYSYKPLKHMHVCSLLLCASLHNLHLWIFIKMTGDVKVYFFRAYAVLLTHRKFILVKRNTKHIVFRWIHANLWYAEDVRFYFILFVPFGFGFHPRWAHEWPGRAAAPTTTLADKPASAVQPWRFFASAADAGPPAALAVPKPPDLPCIRKGFPLQSSHSPSSCGRWGFLLSLIFYRKRFK